MSQVATAVNHKFHKQRIAFGSVSRVKPRALFTRAVVDEVTLLSLTFASDSVAHKAVASDLSFNGRSHVDNTSVTVKQPYSRSLPGGGGSRAEARSAAC